MTAICKLVEQLPPDLQQEAEEFVEFLLWKEKHKPERKLQLDWAGGLKEYRDQYTSLDLQKKAMEWWGD